MTNIDINKFTYYTCTFDLLKQPACPTIYLYDYIGPHIYFRNKSIFTLIFSQ